MKNIPLLCSSCLLIAFISYAESFEVIAPVKVANGSLCSSDEVRNSIRQELHAETLSLLQRLFPGDCPCGGVGPWHQIAHLNMSDPNQQCPPNWTLTSTPVRACGGPGSSCVSAVFPSNGVSYSRVCGRVNAYQLGSLDAFRLVDENVNSTVEDSYLDGVSLTHGAAGSRQHIWSFVGAVYESNDMDLCLACVCSCSNTGFSWPYQVLPFIGSNYFCDSGNSGPGVSSVVYADDPLWDGDGCSSVSSCCKLNNPPWFCTTLPQPTTDDIEARICADEALTNEDTLVSYINIYVM